MFGKNIRIERIIDRQSGNAVIVPMDHGISAGPIPGLIDMKKTVNDVVEGGATAVLIHKGIVPQGHRTSGHDVGLILHLSASTDIGVNSNSKVLVATVEEALKLGADAVSMHINVDAASLIGMDTFEGGQVKFRPGPVYRCAQSGGFGVLDEINMAKNEALAVLHAVLDFRRAIDVPGYERIPLAEETRFIATMNYGYAGTRELNEALTSRFVVIQMPTITEENLEKLLRTQFPDLNSKYVRQFALLFLDLQKKCDSAEISTKALDLRGMLDALRLMRRGVAAGAALDMGITNKAFDSYEQGLIRDAIAARIPAQLTAAKLFD